MTRATVCRTLNIRALGCAVVAAAALLTGCASTRMIDSNVRSFAGTAPAATGASFRFERLPSQRDGDATTERIENAATQALERVGLVRNDSKALYSAQITVDAVQGVRNPYARDRFLGGSSVVVGTGGIMLGFGPMFGMEQQAWYAHSVRVLLRDIASTQVVYEASASFEGPWSDTLNLLPAMLEAALRDYPNANPIPHKVVVELPPPPKEQ
jgi:hypothetical protein